MLLTSITSAVNFFVTEKKNEGVTKKFAVETHLFHIIKGNSVRRFMEKYNGTI